ncbi:UDP-glucose 4-epimerase [Clostridium tepidiprofundi DSM 19306]|uniref:UDP-glucose 4-epimerase n=1 Tax=Clostridium tepidiprofundi DSM 19306 TaxID=1121338 RepID=A0A151AU85_9CLOT|nr:NAD-dependent epimerase/dehydratase family protein [Clostridium tepidiprofundi]KYH31216.1 UDP-glucose 4-epimerase [Clostridium tepidiprofundi DSM 19306]
MKVLVIGGAGFIGSNVVDRLIDEKYDVTVIDNLSTGKIENVNSKASFYLCDIRDVERLNVVFEVEKPEIVIHHAAQIDVQKSLRNPAEDAVINIVGTINVLECCKNWEAKKIVYASSAAVYGDPEYLPVDEEHKVDPISFYGISKHTPEHYIKVYSQLYGMKYTILRYANVYGIRQEPKGEGGVVSIFLDKFLKKEQPTIFGNGEQTRDFIYVEDIVKANLNALKNGDNEIINVSTNQAVTVNELYKSMKEIFESSMSVNYSEERKGDILHSYLDNKKAKDKLEFSNEYEIKEGLRKTIEYYREIYKGMGEVAMSE